jgi:hypothetical protein
MVPVDAAVCDVRVLAGWSAFDQVILGDARAAIAKSLQILRESTPEKHLSRNYFEPAARGATHETVGKHMPDRLRFDPCDRRLNYPQDFPERRQQSAASSSSF